MQTETSFQVDGEQLRSTYGRATRWGAGYLIGAALSFGVAYLFIHVGEYMGVMLGSLSILCLVFAGLHLVETSVTIDPSTGDITLHKNLGLTLQTKRFALGEEPCARLEVHAIGSSANVQRRDYVVILEAVDGQVDVLRTHDRAEAVAALDSLCEFAGIPECDRLRST